MADSGPKLLASRKDVARSRQVATVARKEFASAGRFKDAYIFVFGGRFLSKPQGKMQKNVSGIPVATLEFAQRIEPSSQAAIGILCNRLIAAVMSF